MTRKLTASVAAGALLFVGGCSDTGAPDASRSPTRVLQLVEEITIGHPAQQDVLFNYVTDVAADASGNMYVGDSRSATVRSFAPDGRQRFEVGGKGDAPGQIPMAYQAARVAADSVLLFDYRPVYVVFDAASGSFVRQQLIAVDPESYFSNVLVEGLSNHGLVARLTRRADAPDGFTDVRDVVLLGPGGTSRLLWRGSAEEWLRYKPTDGSGAMSVSKPAPQGRNSFCAVGRERLFCAENDSLVVDVIGISDGRARRIDITHTPINATAADRSAWREKLGDDATFQSLYTPPDAWRPLEGMLFDTDENKLWLKVRVSRSDSITTWWIVDPDADYRASVEVGADHEIVSVRNGKVYARSRNEGGEQWVTRFGSF